MDASFFLSIWVIIPLTILTLSSGEDYLGGEAGVLHASVPILIEVLLANTRQLILGEHLVFRAAKTLALSIMVWGCIIACVLRTACPLGVLVELGLARLAGLICHVIEAQRLIPVAILTLCEANGLHTTAPICHCFLRQYNSNVMKSYQLNHFNYILID